MRRKKIERILAASLLMLAIAAGVVYAQSMFLSDFRVDDTVAGVYAYGAGTQSLNNDQFVIVWGDNRNTDYQIFASIYNNSGAVTRDDYRIDASAGNQLVHTGYPHCQRHHCRSNPGSC